MSEMGSTSTFSHNGAMSAYPPASDQTTDIAGCLKNANYSLALSGLARPFFIPISIAFRRCGAMLTHTALDESDARQHQPGAGDLR